MNNNLQTALPIIIVGALLVWSIYRRARRTVGLQLLQPQRLRNRAILFGVIAIVLLSEALVSPFMVLLDAIGVVLGAVLVYVSIRTTEFQQQGEKVYYRPNMWVGVSLIVILVGRIAFRLVFAYDSIEKTATQPHAANGASALQAGYANDPYIISVFFVLCTYYIGYNLWLIYKHRQLRAPGKENV